MKPSRILPVALALALAFGMLQAGIGSFFAQASPTVSDSTRAKFIASLVAPAQQAESQTGIPASALMAQAIAESEWGTSGLSSSAKNVFNTRCSALATTAQYATLAAKQVGKKYVLGQPVPYNAPSPSSFDCSGLVIWVNNQTKAFVMGDDTAAGLYNRTSAVSGTPSVGDLVFLKNNPARSNGIGHVAVITSKLSNGDWQIIEAKGKAYGVVKSTLSYWKTRKYYTGVRRLPAMNFVGVSGVTQTSLTTSYNSGCTTVSSVKYRTYSSLAKAFLDRATIIAGESAYQSVRGLTGNVTSFVDALAAVDQPKNKAAYATELKDLIKTWKLTDYDTASVPFNLVMTTKKNQTGPKVSALQSLLKQAGQKVTVTGTYDSATKSAVTAYQKTKGLQADGEAGPLTLTALFTSLSLKSGSKGDAVTALHALLQAIGYKTDSGSTVGSATQASIKQFQTSAGLSGSGTVDKNTWTKLFMTLYPAPVPTISGGTAIGQTLTTKAGTWGPAPVELSYRWYRDGKAIANATGTSYKLTEADAGHALTVAVTGSRLPYVTVSRVSAPLNSAALSQLTATPTPVIAGSAAIGKTLTASAGTWKPAPVTLAYQWYRGTAAIAGATKPTYTVQAADAGLALQVAVTGTKAGHAPVAKTSKATAKVSALKLSATPTPTISGTAKVAVKLTAKPGTWKPSGTSLGYQWYRDGKAISKATKSTYTLTTSDQGKRITVKVTGKKSGYTTVTKTSKQTAKVAKASTLTATPTPTISGTAKVAVKLTAKPGTWKPSGTSLGYQWYRDGKSIKNATKASYTLTKSDQGKRITVKVTGKKSGYTTVTKTSKQTAKVAKASTFTKTSTPTIVGTTKVGGYLYVRKGTWTPSSVTMSYQWYRNGKAIKDATRSTYKVTKSDKGKRITVKATGKKSGYLTVSKTSKQTAKIRA